MKRKHFVKVQTSQMLALRDIFHRRILNHRYIFHLSVQHSFPTYSFFFQHSKINFPPTTRCYERTPVRPSIFFLNLYKTLSRHLVSSDVDAIEIHFRCDWQDKSLYFTTSSFTTINDRNLFELLFSLMKITSLPAHREQYISRTNQIVLGMCLVPIRSPRLGYVSRTNQNVVFVL